MSNAHTFTSVDFDPFGGKEIEKITTTTEPQRELWLSCVLGGEDANRAYNESVSLEFDGTFDISSFKKAIHDLILRHEALRSTLSSNGENLVIYKNLPVEINVQDISAKTDEDQKSILNKFLHDELNIAFDLHESLRNRSR